MGDGRREKIAALARRHGLRIIAADVHALLLDNAPAPLAARIPGRTLYIASPSKTLAGGLRVAYIAAPLEYIERLSLAVAASLWSTPALNVALASLWIGDGTASDVLQRKRTEAKERQALARKILPPGLLRSQPHSYFAWLELPPAWTADRFVEVARERGVALTPDRSFAVGSPQPARPTVGARPAVRISLSAPLRRIDVEVGLQVLRTIRNGPPPTEIPTI